MGVGFRFGALLIGFLDAVGGGVVSLTHSLSLSLTHSFSHSGLGFGVWVKGLLQGFLDAVVHGVHAVYTLHSRQKA